MESSNNVSQKGNRYKIKVTQNGPYVVSGEVPISEQIIHVDSDDQCHGWDEGKKFTKQDNCALCRCGKSSNKPFCDGTHLTVKFNSKETASHESYAEQAEKIEGPDLTLTDARDLCAGARFCHRAGGTWKLTEQSSNPEARKIAIEEACDCPSGRLVAWDNEGNAIEPDFEPSIGLVKDPQAGRDGPLWVRAGIPVESADGKIYEVRNRVTLCRCGKSSNKPFCDGTHLK
ncbi:MAG: CDGSH iron-sulfur domain-containing protein [Dehalococcoidales bacterium]|nr:CDGSH iron-sulfur domain-containing protein [Dehalococcoidales bacterium]